MEEAQGPKVSPQTRVAHMPEEEEKTSAKMRASPITTGLEYEIPPQKPLSSTLTRTHRHTHGVYYLSRWTRTMEL